MSSENRRVLKKTESILLKAIRIPEDIKDVYDWRVAKMATDFYSEKFGHKLFSANKIKELLISKEKSNFNSLFAYTDESKLEKAENNSAILGYAICYKNVDLMHYSYPFYDLNNSPKDTGLGMMIRAIMFAKESGLKYIYLGSLQRPTDTYKLQFAGLEWFDGGPSGTGKWSSDTEAVKDILHSPRKL